MASNIDLEIRIETPSDTAAIDLVVRAAFLAEFGSTSEVDLVRTMRHRNELISELCLVAITGNQVVGYLAMSEVTLDTKPARGLGLAPVAVEPRWQGMGIGSRLIEESLTRARRLGWRFVVLLGHEHYYPRFGFKPAKTHGLTGDYGDHNRWMALPLSEVPIPTGHIKYCTAVTT